MHKYLEAIPPRGAGCAVFVDRSDVIAGFGHTYGGAGLILNTDLEFRIPARPVPANDRGVNVNNHSISVSGTNFPDSFVKLLLHHPYLNQFLRQHGCQMVFLPPWHKFLNRTRFVPLRQDFDA